MRKKIKIIRELTATPLPGLCHPSMGSERSVNLKAFTVFLGWFGGLCKSNVSFLSWRDYQGWLWRDLDLWAFKSCPLHLCIHPACPLVHPYPSMGLDGPEGLGSWFQAIVLCLHIKKCRLKECWRKIVVAPLSLTFCSGGIQNFHPSNSVIISILQELFSFFSPLVVTNPLLIIVIPTWSQTLFTPASTLTSQPPHRAGFSFIHQRW